MIGMRLGEASLHRVEAGNLTVFFYVVEQVKAT
jgi:hypothetical protein